MARKKPQLKPDDYNELLKSITRGDLLRAIADYFDGRLHGFRAAREWNIAILGRQIPHRPVIAFAACRHREYQLISDEFSGPMDDKCRARLIELGFAIEEKK